MKDKENNRRKFLNKGLKGVLAAGFSMSAGAVMASGKKTVKCLTQDGELVEVEISDVDNSTSRAVSDEELKNWINHKK